MTAKNIKITRVRGDIRRLPKQKLTMAALGLKKIGSSVEKELTPQIAGMLNNVQHMVVVEEI